MTTPDEDDFDTRPTLPYGEIPVEYVIDPDDVAEPTEAPCAPKTS